MNKDITINGKVFNLHEWNYLEFSNANMQDIKNAADKTHKILELAGVQKDALAGLTFNEVKVLLEEINKLNGIDVGFQKTS